MATRISNVVRHDAETHTTIITVTRANGMAYEVLMDTVFYVLFPGLILHMKRMCPSSEKFYPCCYVDGKLTYLHRIIGEMHLGLALLHGHSDKTTIDHINRNPADCRIDNLRAANNREQMQNRDCVINKGVTPCQN